MLYREIVAVCSEIRIKHIHALCGQNVEFLNVKTAGSWSNLEQYFSTAGPWHQLCRAARGSPGICHFSLLSNFHE